MENGQVYWHMQKEKRRKGQYSDDDTCILLDMVFFLFFSFWMADELLVLSVLVHNCREKLSCWQNRHSNRFSFKITPMLFKRAPNNVGERPMRRARAKLWKWLANRQIGRINPPQKIWLRVAKASDLNAANHPKNVMITCHLQNCIWSLIKDNSPGCYWWHPCPWAKARILTCQSRCKGGLVKWWVRLDFQVREFDGLGSVSTNWHKDWKMVFLGWWSLLTEWFKFS